MGELQKRKESQGIVQLHTGFVELEKLSPEGKQVALAMCSEKIKDMEEADLVKKLGLIIEYVHLDLGLKKSVDLEYIATRVKQMSERYHSSLTISEIKVSFELYMLGSLDDFMPGGTRSRAFVREFTPELYNIVLKGYKRYRGKKVQEIALKCETEEEEVSPEKIKRIEQNFIKTLLHCWIVHLKQGGDPALILTSTTAHKYYIKWGVIDGDEDVSGKAENHAYRRKLKTLNDYEKKHFKSRYREKKQIKEFDLLKSTTEIRQRCILAMTRLKKSNTDLRKLILKHEEIDL